MSNSDWMAVAIGFWLLAAGFLALGALAWTKGSGL
jgi:hypothetical protein